MKGHLIPFGKKNEGFCKPQLNEVRGRFDLLTSVWQGNKSVDERYNAVETQVVLAKYPPETAKILHRDIFWFFLKDEEFIYKTINDSNIDLDMFPASKVRQLAKKMESSKVTTRHIKQVAIEPPGGSDQFDETSVHRSPSKQAQEKEVFCEA